jgi:hypothetical protein
VWTQIVPGCVQFLGEEKRFYTAWTQSGSSTFPGLVVATVRGQIGTLHNSWEKRCNAGWPPF